MPNVEIVAFRNSHLDGVLAICVAEGWPTLPDDPNRAQAMLRAANAVTVVAVDDDTVVGFAFAFEDAGGVDLYLSTMAVVAEYRRRGIGRRLVAALFEESGATRMDLLAEPGPESFYGSLPHREFRGFRIYPDSN